MTLAEAWTRTLRADPTAPALIDAGAARVWTRQELETAARAWAGAGRVGESGRAVFFRLPNGIEWLAAFLNLLRTGRAACAIDPGEPMATAEAIATRAPRRWPAAVEVIKLTSGSTGVPRALPFTGAQMLADGRQICATMGIRSSDRNLGVVPFGHSYGLGNLVVPLLARGTVVICGVDPLPQAIATAVARHGATVFPAVPALLRALAASDLKPTALAALRLVISAGAPLAPADAAAFATRFGLPPHNFYGSSETGGIAYDRSGAATASGRSVGRPLRGVRLRFAARERFSVISPAVGGAGARSIPDRGRLNGRGELVLLGRTDRMLKVAGRRLDPGEVEAALRQVPGVRDAWVGPHPRRPDCLAAVLAVRGEMLGAALADQLRTSLAPWKIPRKWVCIPELPVNGRGKPDRRQLARFLA